MHGFVLVDTEKAGVEEVIVMGNVAANVSFGPTVIWEDAYRDEVDLSAEEAELGISIALESLSDLTPWRLEVQ